jgi:hypothetical protein
MPPTPEKTIKKKKKTQNLQSPNNGSEKVSHNWNPGMEKNKCPLDLTKETKQKSPWPKG